MTGQLQRRQMQDDVKSELVPAKYEVTSSEDEAPGASVLDYSQYYPTLLPFVPPNAETLNAAEHAEGQPDVAAADEVQPRKVHLPGHLSMSIPQEPGMLTIPTTPTDPYRSTCHARCHT